MLGGSQLPLTLATGDLTSSGTCTHVLIANQRHIIFKSKSCCTLVVHTLIPTLRRQKKAEAYVFKASLFHLSSYARASQGYIMMPCHNK